MMKQLSAIVCLLFFKSLLAQDTINIINPYKFKSVNKHRYIFDITKVDYPNFYLTKRRTLRIDSSDTLIINKIENNEKLIYQKLTEKSKTFCIFYFKGKIIEKGYWQEEFFIGFYQLFHKNGQIREEREYNLVGEKIGTWKYYNKKGKLYLILEYENNVCKKRTKV